jgi:hypothetical protein
MLLISSLLLNAQKTAQERLDADRDIFLANDIYVVYTGAAMLDSALKEDFNRFWTIRAIKGFISKEEFKTLIRDERNSFIYPKGYSYSMNRMSNNSARYGSAVFAFNGGRRNLNRYNLLYESVAIEYFDTFLGESEIENGIYRLPFVIKELQWGVNHKYDPSRPLFDKNKTLIINENSIEGKKGASIQRDALAAWPWKYEIMSLEKIAKLIREQNNHYLLLIPILSDMTADIEVYDLACLRSVAAVGGNAMFKNYWVRSKEIQRLVDKINGVNTKGK